MKSFTRRRIHRLDGEEDASEMKLGPEFQNELCLLYPEVKILMEKLKENNEANLGSSFDKTLVYVNHVCKFNNPDTLKEVRKVLSSTQLENFEIAQLANLLPEKSEEAKSLIPSTAKRIDDEELQVVLNELQNLKRFQS
jgi:DNA-directed RNA polymerase II subunit RPB4